MIDWSESKHLHLEALHALRVGHRFGNPPPLGPNEPVPGCGCVICETLTAGGDWEDARIAETIVRRLAQRRPSERRAQASKARLSWLEHGVVLPKVARMLELAAEVPGALREPKRGRHRKERLPVEEARAADILTIATRVGLGDPVRRGSEWAVCCFMHEDSKPSLRLKPDEGLWFCDPCATGGDVIDLVRRVRGCSFEEAVKEAAA